MPTADGRGSTINYIEQGDGVHNVLFLHGFLQSSVLWTSLIRGMSRVEFRRLAFDLPGCGGSSALPNPSVDAMADSVRKALYSIDVERCSVVANGLGGAVAQSLAARYPHLVYKLVLAGTRAFARDQAAEEAEARSLVEAEWNRENLSARILAQYAKKPRQKILDEMLDVAEATDREAASTVATEYARANTLDLLQHITARTLVIHGAKDTICTRNDAEVLQARIPTARLESIDTAGNMPMIDAPRRFKAHMLELLREL